MADETTAESWLALRDPDYVAKLIPPLRAAVKGYFRSEVKGLANIPDGGALLVSNHSGGLVPMDVPVVVVAFVEHFGAERPFYVLAHDGLLLAAKRVLGPAGFIPASRTNAIAALRSGATTIVFPGGDYDVFRPTRDANKIDFAGHTGYVRTALDAGVPIVPVVSIGGQEQFLILFRGTRLARLLGLDRMLRLKVAPIMVGFPFGLTAGLVPSLPLPAKISTRILEPIYIEEEFGPNPGAAQVDRVVRARMQDALNELARQRRFPVIG
ncbi:MAG: 1-acyl-sn-glycerol-3-phosphate acyltransferase [Mycobacterium sp.]